MLQDDESAELRMLQAKAYGRDGGMTPAGLGRLAELEARRNGRSVAPVVGTVESGGDAQLSVVQRGPVLIADSAHLPIGGDVQLPVSGDGQLPVAELVEAPGAGEEKSTHRRHPRRWFAIGAAAAEALGIGIGWAVWEWDSAGAALSAAHSVQRAELEASGEYDPGSVVTMSEAHGVVVWGAQRSNGEEDCILLTAGTRVQSQCLPVAQLEVAGAVGMSMRIPEGEESAGSMLSASLVRSIDGERFTLVQMWADEAYNWESQYSEEELEVVRRLEAAGYDGPSLQILGYDDELAIWQTQGSNETCIIVAGVDTLAEACASYGDEELSLAVPDATVGIVEYHVRLNTNRGPVLTIVRGQQVGDSGGVGSGETLGIDDTTGEVTP